MKREPAAWISDRLADERGRESDSGSSHETLAQRSVFLGLSVIILPSLVFDSLSFFIFFLSLPLSHSLFISLWPYLSFSLFLSLSISLSSSISLVHSLVTHHKPATPSYYRVFCLHVQTWISHVLFSGSCNFEGQTLSSFPCRHNFFDIWKKLDKNHLIDKTESASLDNFR